MKRRSFFKSLARAAAIVALAPQIAFRVKPAVSAIDMLSPLDTNYRCVMHVPKPEYTLYSETYTWLADDPGALITIENFSG